MTDHDIATALRNLSDNVANNRVEISGQIATLTANVGTLQRSHETSAGKLDEVLRLELSCPARAGWDSLGREIGEAKRKISDNRIEVEAELRTMRGKSTGQVDVGENMRRRNTDIGGGSFARMVAIKALPYVLFGGIALGAYLVSGGDNEATARALRSVSDAIASVDSKVGAVEKKVAEVAADTSEDEAPRMAAPMTETP